MERSVLITGCSSGIGRATAEAFLEHEWNVMATARNVADLRGLEGSRCQCRALDVTDDDRVELIVSDTIDRYGRLDCLVNNAGWSQVGPLEDVSTDRLHRQFDVNVYGAHRVARAVLPHMREAGGGTIINVSSGLGRIALPGIGGYAASKFALEAMSDALRAEVSTQGVNVVVIEPGSVHTMFRERAAEELRELDRTDAYEPLYRILDDWAALDEMPGAMEPSVVGDAIVNAASATQPDSRYVVGPTAHLARWGRLLPDSIRDRLYRLALRATSLRRSPNDP